MSLRINTNVAALNSYNNLNANQAKLEGAFQQLSSGLRINKAADDAAGLSIAAGLTSQINGLTQAVSNANDGINVAQIADGALGTTQDILQRMRSLVVKAGNEGTQDAKSLGAIQKEINNLNTQLDNIASQTKFGQTNLLDGKYSFNFQVGANGGDTIRLDLSGAGVKSTNVGGVNLKNLNIASAVPSENIVGGAPTTTPTTITGAFEVAALGFSDNFASATTVTQVGTTNTWNIADGSGNTLGTIDLDSATGVYNVSTVDAEGTSTLVGRVDTAAHDPELTNVGINTTAANQAGSALNKALTSAAIGWAPAAGETLVVTGDATAGWHVSDTGANDLGDITVSGDTYAFTADGDTDPSAWVSSKEFQADGIQSYSTAQASSDMDNLSKAIDAVSASRSQIGAVQNQLNYTVSNLQTAITNVTASRSNLTDADLAQQVTAMTQSQILTQAATSVLAQANSAPQAILKLLQ